MELIDVGYVPTLIYILISLAKIVRAGHKYSGDDPGFIVHLSLERTYFAPFWGTCTSHTVAELMVIT